jgi:hypothetical protein
MALAERPARFLSSWRLEGLQDTMVESGPMIDHRKLHRRRNDRFEQYVIDEMASLRAALDIQFNRIAQIQAELDLSQDAIKQRSLTFPSMPAAKLSRRSNGNGHR